MIPPYGRTSEEVYNDLNEELKTKGFEFDKYFRLSYFSELKGAYRFPNDTNFFLDEWNGEPCILACCESVGHQPIFLSATFAAIKENPQVARTIATVTEQLLNGWQYDESKALPVRDCREKIRFITPDYKTKFYIRDGDYIRVQSKSDPNDYKDLRCRFHDEYHLSTPYVYHICEFAERKQGATCTRLPAQRPAYTVAFTPDGINFEEKEVPIADTETMLKNLVGDVIKTGRCLYNSRTLFQGTKGAAMFGLTRHGELTSLHPDYFYAIEKALSNDLDKRVYSGVFFEDEWKVIDEAKAKCHEDIKKCLIDYYEKKAQNSSCVIDANKAKASNTETNTKVARTKKDTGRGR